VLSNVDIQKVFKDHVTKHQQNTTDRTWHWTCSCGQEKTVDTREMCQTETHNHWSAKIIELQPADTDVPFNPPENEVVEGPIPVGLDLLSYVVREVDCSHLNMPQGRKLVSEWAQRPSIFTANAVRDRLRRLKQITDAVYEEVSTTLASKSGNA
jgi:hypothetical protein